MGRRASPTSRGRPGQLLHRQQVEALCELFGVPPETVVVHQSRIFCHQGAVTPLRGTPAAKLLASGGLVAMAMLALGLLFFTIRFLEYHDALSFGALGTLGAAAYLLFLPMASVSLRSLLDRCRRYHILMTRDAPNRKIFVLAHELAHIEVEARIRRGECTPRFREHLTNGIAYARLREAGYPVDQFFA